MLTLNVKPSENARELYLNHKAAYEGDSGIDLFFVKGGVCPPGSTTFFDLEISCMLVNKHDIPISYYVYPRSSISKTPLIMHNSVGIIDAMYRHSIKVAVYNTSNQDYFVNPGDRLFQICSASLESIKVNVVDSLPGTLRGEGFGSSGTSKR
jgi:dUTP pyrophosphatase